MNKDYKKGDTETKHDDFEQEEDFSDYDELELLERLESLREDMEELGVTTLDEVNQRIDELHRALDRR